MEFCQRADWAVTAPALGLSGIHKRYGNVVALHDVSLTVHRGTIHALLGENGAGKTTLMRVAFGLTLPDEGTVRVNGSVIAPGSPAHAIRAGIGMVQQHFTLVPPMTIAENVALGMTTARRLTDETMRLAAEFGLHNEWATPVGGLPVAVQQRVELLKALSRGARVLILDEPTAALPPAETERLLAWLKEFRDRGGSVVLITHRLRDALEIADEITVLRHGVSTWNGARERATMDTVLTAMLGAQATPSMTATDAFDRTASSAAAVIAEARSIVVHDARGVTRLREASVRVRGGEIVGVAGVEGSGTRELLLALAGRGQPAAGDLTLPNDVGFVPEDRHHDALLLDRSVADNIALKGAGRRRGWLHRSATEAEASRLVATSGILAPDVRAPVSTLSGGNQQRLVLARELAGQPALLVAANPTRGLDVAAAREIQQRLAHESRRGMAVVYYSADLDELLDVADRMLVLFDGRVTEVTRDRDAIGRAMLGAA
jgi:simple sugar transport system ATP-binding protein